MKVGIMQPYFFPYIGYFQLINAVDVFIFYDDVNFIKGGWINRNRIIVNNSINFFTVPLSNPSSFRLISETKIKESDYEIWREKFFKTLKQSYKRAPYYKNIIPMIEKVLEQNLTISNLAKESIISTLNYLKIEKQIVLSSKVYSNTHLKGQERVLDICKQERANQYYNLVGGRELYNKDNFEENGIYLKFLNPISVEYNQLNKGFIPGLSIIDVLMFNSKEEILEILGNFELV